MTGADASAERINDPERVRHAPSQLHCIRRDSQGGLAHQSKESVTLSGDDMLLLNCIVFAGIHTDPSSRCGGNRSSRTRRPLFMTGRLKHCGLSGGIGDAARIPSSAREGSSSSSCSSKAIDPGHDAPAQFYLFRLMVSSIPY